MPIYFDALRKNDIESSPAYQAVSEKAAQLRDFLDEELTQGFIAEKHVHGVPSLEIQKILLPKARELGFESEKKGLFATYTVSRLRPDYFCPVGETGILLEVERGKTTTNNMDLLDLWKCHICHHARFLFLVLPKFRIGKEGVVSQVSQEYKPVHKRLTPFFEPRNYVNVDAVFLFGY